jgi:hypothetical protein
LLRIQSEERNAHKNVVMHKKEHDDMASVQPLDKPAAADRKLPAERRSTRQQPQIPSPLASDGPELMRDTHC